MENNDGDGGGGERDAKRLRSSEPDLKVVLGSGEVRAVRWHHSQTLASKSRYVDAMLSAPMRERDEREISFPDIDIDQWEDLLKFLDDPVAARRMDARRAVRVAPLYDKYEFPEGRRLCDLVLAEYFRSIKEQEDSFTLDLEFAIRAATVAHEANLDDALNESIAYFWGKLRCADKPYGKRMFTEEHLEELRPILKHSSDNRGRLGLVDYCSQSTTFGRSGMLDRPDFPSLFVLERERWDYLCTLLACITSIEVSGTSCEADGKYIRDGADWTVYLPAETRNDSWGSDDVTFSVEWGKFVDDNDDFWGWAIVRKHTPMPFSDITQKCWMVPYSRNEKCPPHSGWVSCDPLAKGKPKIKYILRNTMG